MTKCFILPGHGSSKVKEDTLDGLSILKELSMTSKMWCNTLYVCLCCFFCSKSSTYFQCHPISPKYDGWKSAMFLFYTSKVEFLSRDGLRFYRTNYSENMFCRRGEELILETLLWIEYPSTSQPQMLLKRVRVSTLSAKDIRMSLQ